MISDKQHAEMIRIVLEEIKHGNTRIQNGWLRQLEVESPFNYYGERGFVDIVDYDRADNNITFWEMKTDLRNVGETLRQMHKTRDYFLKARSSINGYKIGTDVKAMSRLVFLDTPENWQIFNDNIELFLESDLMIDVIRNGKRQFIGHTPEGKEWHFRWVKRYVKSVSPIKD